MKRVFITAIAIANICLANAQSEMKPAWETKLEHACESNEFNDQTGIIISSDEKNMSIIDANTGKVKWFKSFKELSGGLLKKVDERIPMWDANVLFLFDRKGGKDEMAVVDLENGKMLWNSEKYEGVTGGSVAYIPELEMFAIASKKAFHMIKARTGEEIWETQGFKGALGKYYYSAADHSITALNYNQFASSTSGGGNPFAMIGKAFGAFKSQLTKMNVKTGDVLWQSEVKGTVEKEIKTGKLLAKLKPIGTDKLMLSLEGVQMFDMASGKLIWSVTYDPTALEERKRGIGSGYSGSKLIRSAVYRAIAEPLIDGNDIYVFDMASKKSQYIRKYDINTGKLIWSSEELKQLTIAPNMYKINNKIVLQIGGWAEVQGIVEQKSQGFGNTSFQMTTHKKVKFFKEYGPFGVEAFDASNGQNVWRSERFKKGVTNAFEKNGQIMVCSGKALYSLGAEDGKEKYEVSIMDDDINQSEQIFCLGDNAIVVGERGLAAHDVSTGKKVWAVRTKKGDLYDISGTIAFYATEKNDQVAVDLTKGSYTTYDARKDGIQEATDDGEHLFVFEKKTISKLKTH